MADKLLAEWFWVDRWMGSSAFLLPMEARGIYREMLSQAWRRGACLPADHEMVCRAIGCTKDEWDRNWKRIERYWSVIGDVMVNETQAAVYRECLLQREKASEHARRAAQARHARADARVLPEHKPEDVPGVCPPDLSPDLDLEPPPEKKSRRSRGAATWLTPFAEIWTAAYGGDINFGQAGKSLKKPVATLGAAEVESRLRRYCSATEGQYASIAKFASTIGTWKEGVNGNGHSGGKQTPHGKAQAPISDPDEWERLRIEAELESERRSRTVR